MSFSVPRHSPLQIKIALHYWVVPGQYEGPEDKSFVKDLCGHMVNYGLLETCDDGYCRGPALQCYVDALCSIPWPVQVWKIPDGTDD